MCVAGDTDGAVCQNESSPDRLYDCHMIDFIIIIKCIVDAAKAKFGSM
jgi:hypothetical protein